MIGYLKGLAYWEIEEDAVYHEELMTTNHTLHDDTFSRAFLLHLKRRNNYKISWVIYMFGNLRSAGSNLLG